MLLPAVTVRSGGWSDGIEDVHEEVEVDSCPISVETGQLCVELFEQHQFLVGYLEV